MSFIVFDFKCTECGASYPNVMVKRSEMDEQKCGKCYAALNRLPAGPTTTFKMHDRSAIKSKKAVSLRGPNHGASSKGHSKSLD